MVSVASNVVPFSFARLCALAQAGDAAAARALDDEMAELYHFLGVEPNPIPVKALLALDGIGHGLRLPLLVVVGISWIAWALAFRRRRAIFATFEPQGPAPDVTAA